MRINKNKLIHSLKMMAIYLLMMVAIGLGCLCSVTVMFHLLNGLGMNWLLAGIMILCMVAFAGLMDLKRRIKDPD